MKRTNTFTLAALAALCLAGCTQDDERTAAGLPMTGTPMRVVAHVDAPMTREAMTTNDLTRYYFRVTDADGGTDEYNYFTTMKLENGQWSASQEMTWQSTYPKVSALEQKGVEWTKEEYTTGKIVSVQTNQSDRETGLLKSDLLYMAPKAISAADLDNEGNIKVNLAHRFAKLKVVVNVTGATTNPITALTIGGTQTTATFTPETDVLTLSGNVADIIPYRESTETSTSGPGYTATYECILLPQQLAANTLEVTAIMDEGNKSYTHAEALTLNSNYQYTLTLNMAYNGTMKPSGDVNVGTWGDEEAGSGELKEEEGAVIEGGTYYVSTARGLQEWAQAVAQQGGGRDPNLILTDDIDMRGKTWPNTGVYLLGTIDGRGYTIKNLTLTGDYSGIGLISGFAANSSIKNLTLLNPSITSDNAGGFFIGSVAIKTTMENCHVIGGTAINADMTGCLAHSANESSFTACSVTSSNVESMINSIPAGEVLRSKITACYVTGGNLVGSTVGAPIPTYTASYYQNGGDITSAEDESTETSWSAAAEKMNTELSGTAYQWIVNTETDAADRPLIIDPETIE